MLATCANLIAEYQARYPLFNMAFSDFHVSDNFSNIILISGIKPKEKNETEWSSKDSVTRMDIRRALLDRKLD